MNAPDRPERDESLALAYLRATLIAMIFVSEQLIDARRLADSQFFAVLGVAAVYALAGIMTARGRGWPRLPEAMTRLAPGVDMLLLLGLAYTSGGAFSDVRKAFFVVPLAAAFSERPRSAATWSLAAVAGFTIQAVIAGGHPTNVQNTWQRLTINQDLYLAWTGAAATVLATALRHRSAHTEELARSRQRLVTRAIESVERERTRLAGALHDSPVQNLIAARHDLRRAERAGDPESFRRVHAAIDETIAQLREEIFHLHPHVLDHVGLAAALEQVAQRFGGEAGVRIEVDSEADASPAHRQVLFALGRELLGNAFKHAAARHVQLTLSCEDEWITLEVRDDGRGMTDARMRDALLEGHVGLAAVHERVAAAHGTVSVRSRTGSGTTVQVRLPSPTPRPVRAPAEVSDRVTAVDTLRVSPA